MPAVKEIVKKRRINAAKAREESNGKKGTSSDSNDDLDAKRKKHEAVDQSSASQIDVDDVNFASYVSESHEECELKMLEITRELKERNEEFKIFSEEIFKVKADIITANRTNLMLVQEKMSIERKITTTILAKEEYQNKWRMLVSKAEKKKKIKEKKESAVQLKKRRIRILFSKKKCFIDVRYSNIKNNHSKKIRKEEALSYLQLLTGEKDIKIFLIDFLKFIELIPDQSFKLKLSEWQAVVLKTKLNITKGQLEGLKCYMNEFNGFDFLPHVKSTCKLAKTLSHLNLFKPSTHVVNDDTIVAVQCTDVYSILKVRLERLFCSEKLIFDDFTKEDIVIGIGGDCGGGENKSTKLCLIIGNVKNPNSTHHILTIALYDSSDNYTIIKEVLKPLINQLNCLSKIKYEEDGVEVERRVRQVCVGDFKFVGEMLAHMKQRARFFCFFCLAENRQRISILGSMDITKKDPLRTTSSYSIHSKTGEYGVYRGDGPLLKKVEIEDYFPGMLHLTTGLFSRFVEGPLWQEAVSIDNSTTFIIFSDRNKTLEAADREIEKLKAEFGKCVDLTQRKKIGEELKNKKAEKATLKQIVFGVPNGKLRQLESAWESVGATRRAFFQKFTGNHTKKLLTKRGIDATFNCFKDQQNSKLRSIEELMNHLSVVMSLSANRLLLPVDLDLLQKSITSIATCLQSTFPQDNPTQKLHILLYHCLDIAKKNGTLGRISEQGIECVHTVVNRLERRFSSFRNKEKRYMHILQEMLCLNLVHDFEIK